MEYETAKRHYAHVDCPGHADYVKVRRKIYFFFFFPLGEFLEKKKETC